MTFAVIQRSLSDGERFSIFFVPGMFHPKLRRGEAL
jgi:hypothetical protein